MNTTSSFPDMSSANYFTTLEVAKMLGMAVRSVQLMVDRGDLQAWKTPGGHRRITRDSLERWLHGTRGTTSGAGALTGVTGQFDMRQSSRRRGGVHIPRILLIDDSVHFQNMVSMLVRQQFPAIDVQIAHDGITGLVAYGQLQPDLIILDILLPGIDGATMITGLRRHAVYGKTQIIVTTSLEEQQLAPYAFALSDVPVVHKHRLMQDLPALIQKAMGHLLRPAAEVADAPAAEAAEAEAESA